MTNTFLSETTTELPRVTVELDSGPVEMAFGYVPKGKPTYGDVSPRLDPCASEGAAEVEGAFMLAIGNWQSFTVEKRYYAVPRSSNKVEAS